MTDGRDPRHLEAYAQAVEQAWSTLTGRPAVLSPRDWRWLTEWYGKGIPIAIIHQAMRRAAQRRATSGQMPRGLSWIAPAIDEEWRSVIAGKAEATRPHRGQVGSAGSAGLTRQEAIDAWRACRLTVGPGSPLGEALDDVLSGWAQGADPETVDAALDRHLPDAVPPALRAEVEVAVARDLAIYRGRMPAGALETTANRALVDRLRRRLNLPRLSPLAEGDDSR